MIQYETKNPWDAARTEIFFNQSTNKLAYRDRLGIVFDLGNGAAEVQTLNLNVAGTVNVVYTDGTDAYLWDVETSTYVAIGTRGTNYIIVKGTGTPTENAVELQEAYDYATTAEPNGNPLDFDNRFTIVVSPGYYDFNSAYETAFEISYSYIDLTSLTGNKDVIIQGGIFLSSGLSNISNMIITNSIFTVTNDYAGVITNCESLENFSFSPGTTSGTFTGTFIDCVAGDYAFGFYQNTTGTFKNCTAGAYSFGSSDDNTIGVGYASGIFINCTAASYSFGVYGEASGTFTNCKAKDYSFGYACEASGIFKNCKGQEYCFGVGDIPLEIATSASGTFIDCTANNFSFGYLYRANGTFTRCIAGHYSFGSTQSNVMASATGGTFTDCIANDNSFGFAGDAAGTFTNCTGYDTCFGSSNNTTFPGSCSGTFTNCNAHGFSFGYLGNITSTAIFNNCVSGEYSFCSVADTNANILCEGVFNNCQAQGWSFGYNATLRTTSFNNCSAKAYSFCAGNSATTAMDPDVIFNNCTAENNSFGAFIDFKGKAYYCVGGIYAFGGDDNLSGQLYYCRVTVGSFATVSGSGITRYCINADNTTDNQG